MIVGGLLALALAMGSIQAVRELTGIFPSVTIGTSNNSTPRAASVARSTSRLCSVPPRPSVSTGG